MMFRWVLRATLFVILICFFCIGSMHLLPTNRGDVRDLLLEPDGCERMDAPCFMGMQPGVTSAVAVLIRLKTHAWVDEVTVTRRLVTWTWSDAAPSTIDRAQAGSVRLSGTTVQRIDVHLNTTYGAFWLAMGQPERRELMISGVTIAPETTYHLAQNATYRYGDDWSLRVQSEFDCPLDHYSYWSAAVQLRLESGLPPSGFEYTMANWERDTQICSRGANG